MITDVLAKQTSLLEPESDDNTNTLTMIADDYDLKATAFRPSR
jgi:hypothetical protein